MKRILVLFAKDWDRLEFSRPEYRDRYEFIFEGFDLFRFPGNAQLLWFDVFGYVNRLAARFRRERLDGIVSNNEQFGALVAAVLAEKLGLPGNDPRTVITTYGSSRWVNAIEGEPGKRLVKRWLRVLCHPLARSRWLALYDMDRTTTAARAAFLERVEQALT